MIEWKDFSRPFRNRHNAHNRKSNNGEEKKQAGLMGYEMRPLHPQNRELIVSIQYLITLGE